MSHDDFTLTKYETKVYKHSEQKIISMVFFIYFNFCSYEHFEY
jgi:hypothetical protein